MLKDLVLQYSSRRAACKCATVAGGVGILAIAAIEKFTSANIVFWMIAPLLALWLLDAGYVAEQCRCGELLKKNGGSDDSSAWLPEAAIASVFRFVSAMTSLSLWPFYLILFGLVAFGGEEIVKANKEASAQAVHNLSVATPMQPYYQPMNGSMGMPPVPQRPGFNQQPFNPAMQRFTPPPFPTPPRFTIPNRSPVPSQSVPVTPPRPVPSQNATPAPGAKNP